VGSLEWQILAISGSSMKEEFLTIPDVAKLLKLGERTIYQLARDGRLGGAAKVGGQWRVEKSSLLAWLKAGGDAQERSA
jgi:excisionase family DNA binding protein